MAGPEQTKQKHDFWANFLCSRFLFVCRRCYCLLCQHNFFEDRSFSCLWEGIMTNEILKVTTKKLFTRIAMSDCRESLPFYCKFPRWLLITIAENKPSTFKIVAFLLRKIGCSIMTDCFFLPIAVSQA